MGQVSPLPGADLVGEPVDVRVDLGHDLGIGACMGGQSPQGAGDTPAGQGLAPQGDEVRIADLGEEPHSRDKLALQGLVGGDGQGVLGVCNTGET